MFCKGCGKEVGEYENFCVHCGTKLTDNPYAMLEHADVHIHNEGNSGDTQSNGLNMLGFIVPLAGLVYCLMNRKKYPNRCKSIVRWSLAGWAVSYIIQIIMYM